MNAEIRPAIPVIDLQHVKTPKDRTDALARLGLLVTERFVKVSLTNKVNFSFNK